jgi:hypothetical protein
MAKSPLIALSALLLVCGLEASPALGGQATFNLTNNARFNVMVKVFAKDRHWTWPATTRHWDLDNSAQHSLSIACQDGEQVCFGGAYTANNATYWGVGFKGDKGCQDCCLTCGNASHSWSLIDKPGSGKPLHPTGQAIDPGSVGIPADD